MSRGLIEFAHEYAMQCADADADYVIGAARLSGDEPVVIVTSNQYMPVFRALPNGDGVWQASNDSVVGWDENHQSADELWEDYCDRFNETCEQANVYVAVVDNDNCLYAVDLDRYEFTDHDEESETLSGQWSPRVTV
jgi:hypothetical protein